jgi:pyridine nucleotide-disulfide oxidoreductase family protein
MADHRLLLVGGGHAHVEVIRALAERPEPGLAVTLVTDRLLTPYSGMLPGHIAGFYSHADMHIDLGRLAAVSGVTVVPHAATAVSRAERRVTTRDGNTHLYDTLSLNVGVTPDLAGIVGADRYAVAVKPISTFLDRLDALLAAAAGADGPRRILVVGGGAAGFELSLALKTRLAGLDPAGRPFWIGLAVGSGLLETMNASVRRRARAALSRQGVTVLDDFRAVEIATDGVRSSDGRMVAADAVLISTAARAPAFLASLGLPTDAGGFVLTTRCLQSVGDPAIFAVGDCATLAEDPRPKAGVFAVRQGRALTGNLRRRVRGESLEPHVSDPDYLSILMTGERSAIAGRGGWFAVEGRWVWLWKDWIDRRFMRRFQDFRS